MRVCGPGPVGGYIKIWAHPSYGFELYSTFVDHGAHDVRFTADGSAVVFTCRAGLLAWYLDDRRIETRLAATDSTRLSISEDGRWAAEQTVDEVPIRIRIFDLETAAERLTLEVSHKLPSSYFFFHFSKDGNRLVGVRRGSGDKPATATIWDLLTVREERSFAIDPYSVRSALSPDGNYLAAEYSADSIVQIWNTSNGELICTAGKQVDIRCLAYSPDGRILATGGEGTKNKKRAGEIKIWDATNGDELATIYDENSWGVTAMAFSPDGRTLASGNGDGMVVFWKVPEHLVTANVQQ